MTDNRIQKMEVRGQNTEDSEQTARKNSEEKALSINDNDKYCDGN
jgi:hypothetical protein